MGVADVTDPNAVLTAMAEFDSLGRSGFLEKYGFGRAREYFVEHNGRLYDSKALLGAAHLIQRGAPLPSTTFNGGAQTTTRLGILGFRIQTLTSFDEMPSGRIFGHVLGYPVGSLFASRTALAESGVHRPPMAGISGSESEGADSIVVSGGYEDDEDYGDVIVYTGHGGNDTATKKQIADQEFKRGNLALARSCDEGLPVRIVRGAGGAREHSPVTGFRYDGLYRVDQYWHKIGRSGFRIYQYRLVRIDDAVTSEVATPDAGTRRVESSIQRIVRNTAVSQHIKVMYRHACQVCGLALETPTGPYAEGAHIRPLGRPHDGPDVEANLLCLCANHHVLFDAGAIVIEEDLTVRNTLTGLSLGVLGIAQGHSPSAEEFSYHRKTIGVV